MKISNPIDIKKINDLIHDNWFSVDEVSFNNKSEIVIKFDKENTENAEVVKKILFFQKMKIPLIECFLKIYHVKESNLVDQQKINKYDMNKIEFDPKTNLIKVVTGIPTVFEILVEKFEIEIEKTVKVNGHFYRWQV